MAIDSYGFRTIKRLIDIILEDQSECKVLLLGYADVVLNKNELKGFLSNDIIESLKVREDKVNVAAMFNKEDLAEWCCETYSLFESMRCKLEIVDFTSWTGNEKILDLNYPVDKSIFNQYDLVIDSGTTEHIFNLPVAMQNILNMTKVNGYIHHTTPFNDPNHGFYSISPTFYVDFYEENGAEIISINKTQIDYKNKEISLPRREVFKLLDGMNSVVAKKNIYKKDLIYPVQGRYKSSSADDAKKLLNTYKDFNNIILIPFNGQSRNLKELFKNKNVTILDDNSILNKYSDIDSISNVINIDYDIILITSVTFEDRIRKKLNYLNIDNDKIKLQY